MNQQRRKTKKPDGSLLISKRLDPQGNKAWEIRDSDPASQNPPVYVSREEGDTPFDIGIDRIAKWWESIYSCWFRFQDNNVWQFCWNWKFNRVPEDYRGLR